MDVHLRAALDDAHPQEIGTRAAVRLAVEEVAPAADRLPDQQAEAGDVEIRQELAAAFLAAKARETIHPNGFTYTLPYVSGSSGPKVVSPTDAQLAAYANWSLAGVDPKSIAIARIISNG